MSLDKLIRRDNAMREDVLEVLFGDMKRIDFMTKYRLSKGGTVNYIVQARREFDHLNIHLAYIGECNLNYSLKVL